MTLSKSAISVFTSFVGAMFLVTSCGFAEILCPKLVPIEVGGSGMVSCDTMGKEIVNIFWYTGDPATTNPILRLENGKPGGTEYGRGHYNISSSGAMIITNATIKQEALYNALIYFSDGTSESIIIKVNITISPRISCPAIDVCTLCEDCSLAVNGSGKLMCRISGARPSIALKWVVETNTGVSFVEHPPIFVRDTTSDTWNSSAEISYDISSCNQEANVQCVALDDFNRLERSKSSVGIYSGKCRKGSPATIPNNTTPNVFIIIIIVAVVCISVISAVVLLTRILISRRQRNADGYECTSQTALDEEDHHTSNVFSLPEVKTKDREKLVRDLKMKYKASRFSNLLSSWKSIEVADIYVACCCEVKHSQGDSYGSSTDKLLTSTIIRNDKRVQLTAMSHNGRIMFTSQFVQKWIENANKDFILLYMSRKEVEANKTLIDIIKKEISVDTTDLVKCIKAEKSILLIDGLANVTFLRSKATGKVKESTSKDEKIRSKSRILDDWISSTLLRGLDEKARSKISIWIASCSGDIFPSPHATVHISDVDKKHYDDFVGNVCAHFNCLSDPTAPVHSLSDKVVGAIGNNTGEFPVEHENQQKNERPSGNQGNATQSQSFDVGGQEPDTSKQETENLLSNTENNKENNVTTMQDKLKQNVRECLEKYNIFNEFKDLPFLLSLIVYTVADNYASHVPDPGNIKLDTKEKLVCAVMKRLKEHFVSHESKDNPQFSLLDLSLGKLALSFISTESRLAEDQSSVSDEWNEEINFAIELGILRHKKHVSNSESSNKNLKPDTCNCENFDEENPVSTPGDEDSNYVTFKPDQAQQTIQTSDDESCHKDSKLSLCDWVEFSHEYFKYYFAVTYTMKNKQSYPKLLETDEILRCNSILKFIIYMEDSSLKYLCEAYRRLDMYDKIIDCLHEQSDNEDADAVIAKVAESDIKITGLDDLKHRDAFKSYFEKCIKKGIKVKSLSINSVFSMSFLTTLDIPDIDNVTICEMELFEDEFVRIVEWLSRKATSLRFLHCKIPTTFVSDFKKMKKTLENSKLKAILQEDSKQNIFSFNYKKLQWTKGMT